jgi:hypothetical protein
MNLSTYSVLNISLLATAAVITWRCLRSPRDRAVVLKVSVAVSFLGFPWDFFGIHQKAWTHPNPGPVLFGVPLNEVLLSFLMAYITAGILLHNSTRIFEDAGGEADAKDSSENCAEGNPD